MTDTECVVCRCVTCSEARSAERGLYDRTALDQVSHSSIFCQLHIDRCTCRINAQGKFIISDIIAAQNICCITDIFVAAARAACNNTLIHVQTPVSYFIFQCEIYRAVKTDFRTLLHIIKNIHQICIQFLDGIGIARMERHRDHRPDRTKVNRYHTIIVSNSARIQFAIVLTSSMNLIKFFDRIIRFPD